MKQTYTSPSEFSDDFQLAYKNYWNQANEIDRQIERLKKKKEKLFYPRLKDELHKLAVEIQKELKADIFEVSHHGGLSNKVSIWFTNGQPSKEDRFSNVVGYLCFAEYRDGEIYLFTNTDVSLKDLSLDKLVNIAKENY